jgi:hypothetical protein
MSETPVNSPIDHVKTLGNLTALMLAAVGTTGLVVVTALAFGWVTWAIRPTLLTVTGVTTSALVVGTFLFVPKHNGAVGAAQKDTLGGTTTGSATIIAVADMSATLHNHMVHGAMLAGAAFILCLSSRVAPDAATAIHQSIMILTLMATASITIAGPGAGAISRRIFDAMGKCLPSMSSDRATSILMWAKFAMAGTILGLATVVAMAVCDVYALRPGVAWQTMTWLVASLFFCMSFLFDILASTIQQAANTTEGIATWMDAHKRADVCLEVVVVALLSFGLMIESPEDPSEDEPPMEFIVLMVLLATFSFRLGVHELLTLFRSTAHLPCCSRAYKRVAQNQATVAEGAANRYVGISTRVIGVDALLVVLATAVSLWGWHHLEDVKALSNIVMFLASAGVLATALVFLFFRLGEVESNTPLHKAQMRMQDHGTHLFLTQALVYVAAYGGPGYTDRDSWPFQTTLLHTMLMYAALSVAWDVWHISRSALREAASLTGKGVTQDVAIA